MVCYTGRNCPIIGTNENNNNSFFVRNNYGNKAANSYLIGFFNGRKEAKKYEKLSKQDPKFLHLEKID